MEKRKNLDKSEKIFIGIDLHKRTWHVTIRTFDIELFMEKVIYQIHFWLLGIWASRSSKDGSNVKQRHMQNWLRFGLATFKYCCPASTNGRAKPRNIVMLDKENIVGFCSSNYSQLYFSYPTAC